MRRAAGAVLVLALAACLPRPEPDAKLGLLREVLASGNDNDPRLDTAFLGLSPEAKRLFRAEYRRIPRERRAARGTVVYLLGQNLADKDDWEFLRSVVSEPACLSLADCAKPGPSGEGDAVTLAYPALVALRQAQRARQSGAAEAASVIAAAKDSGSPAVARMAERLAAAERG